MNLKNIGLLLELIMVVACIIFMIFVCWKTFLALFLWLKVPTMISKGLSFILTFIVFKLGKSCKNG